MGVGKFDGSVGLEHSSTKGDMENSPFLRPIGHRKGGAASLINEASKAALAFEKDCNMTCCSVLLDPSKNNWREPFRIFGHKI